MSDASINREANYDFLRVVCTISVITIHVSAFYVYAMTGDHELGERYLAHTLTIILYNTLSQFAVPCFMMLSGAFLLADSRNREFRYFYRKSFKNIGIPTLIFSIFYFCLSEAMSVIRIINGEQEISRIFELMKDFLKGEPYYHMWYLYTLLVVYLFVPVLLRVKEELGEDAFCKISWVYMAMAMLSGITSSFQLNWSISKAVCFIGFLMAGYQIRVYYRNRKNNGQGIFFIALGILLELPFAYPRYQSVKGFSEIGKIYAIVVKGGIFSPLGVASSLMIFAGFSRLYLANGRFKHLAEMAFLIYLFHAGVCRFVERIFRWGGVRADCRLFIPAGIGCVFFLSYILAVMYHKSWRVLDRDERISDWLCKKLGNLI